MTYPLTVAMTPNFRYGGNGDWLLRAQLRCLSEQKFKDFDVYLIDLHYQKRKGYIPELAAHYKLNLVHVPYLANLHVAKRLDCAEFNAPYLFSESKRIVRYSCWRFVRPNFTEICASVPHCVDFYFHNVEAPTRDSMHPVTNHDARIWNIGSDVVNWDLMPKKAGDPGASWTAHSDKDAPLAPFPLNCFANYMIPREDWLRINGCDEAIFSSEHWEDQDFCQRANNAGLKCERRAGIKARLHHMYGQYSGRANEIPDFGDYRKICQKCEAVEYIQKPNRRELKKRLQAGEIEIFYQAWVCKECRYCGPVFHADEGEYLHYLRKNKITRSNVIKKHMIGRNLWALAKDMDGKTIQEKVSIFNDSWTNPRYYSE